MKALLRSYGLLIALLAMHTVAFAHNGSIRGSISERGNGKPIAGANVYIDSAATGVVTDMFGKFFLKDMEPGKHTITVSYVGYETLSEEFAVEDGVTTELQYKLVREPIRMSDVAVTAMKDQKLTTIKISEMKLRPVNSSQDLMRLVPGLFIAQHQGGGKAEQIFIRGFDCDHGTDINISVDNMPVNMVSHAHGQGFADAHFIIPESVQQLDFGKGPYEADKGNFYTGGYIGFKTKNSLENNFASTEGGRYNYLRTATGINLLNSRSGRASNSDAYIIGEYVYNKGYFDAPQDLNRINVTGKYTNNISPGKRISLTLTAFSTYWNASGQIPERAVEQGLIDIYGSLDKEGGRTSRYNANLEYFQSIHDNSYLRSNIFLTKYDFLLYSNFTFFASDSVNGDQIKQAENRILAGYNTEYTSNAAIGKVKFKTQVGAGIRYDNIMNDELSNTAGKTVLLNRIAYGDVHELNLSGYASEKIGLFKNLTLNLGIRYDMFLQQYNNKLPEDKEQSSAATSRISPKSGLCYNINTNTRAYYSYGTGFHTNDTRTINLGAQLGGNVVADHVVPRAFSHDIGVEHNLGSKVVLGAAVWRIDIQQEFGYSGDAAVIDTSGRSRRSGLDLSARCSPVKNLTTYIDLNFAHGRFIDQPIGQNYIPLAPWLTSTGGVKYAFSKSISAGLHYRHMSDRPGNSDGSLTAKGYTIFDAAISYCTSRVEYNMQVQNLFNTKWREAQFETETRLRSEVAAGLPARTDICFTPGTPLFLKFGVTFKF